VAGPESVSFMGEEAVVGEFEARHEDIEYQDLLSRAANMEGH
jgi:hypothetical protein